MLSSITPKSPKPPSSSNLYHDIQRELPFLKSSASGSRELLVRARSRNWELRGLFLLQGSYLLLLFLCGFEFGVGLSELFGGLVQVALQLLDSLLKIGDIFLELQGLERNNH